MRILSRFLFVLTLPFFLGGSVWAQEQDPAEDQAPARDTEFTLTLSHVIGQPGKDAGLSILFGRKPGAPNVAKLRVRMTYPSAVLKFNRAEDAYLSRRVNLQIQGREEKGSGADSVLELNFDLPDPQGTNFPRGQLAMIYFDIAADAPDQVVPLNPQGWIDGAEILPDSPMAQIEPGAVRVAETPVFVGCFFFTH